MAKAKLPKVTFPNEHPFKVTDRYMRAMKEIIINNKLSGGPIRSVKDFAASMGIASSNFSRMENAAYQRFVSVDLCCKLCEQHSVSAEWLLLGRGSMFSNQEHGIRLDLIEKRLEDYEDRIVRLELVLKRDY